MGEQIHIYD